jgi:hypothetical protein
MFNLNATILDNTSFDYQKFGNLMNALEKVQTFLEWEIIFFKGQEELLSRSEKCLYQINKAINNGRYEEAFESLTQLMIKLVKSREFFPPQAHSHLNEIASKLENGINFWSKRLMSAGLFVNRQSVQMIESAEAPLIAGR